MHELALQSSVAVCKVSTWRTVWNVFEASS